MASSCNWFYRSAVSKQMMPYELGNSDKDLGQARFTMDAFESLSTETLEKVAIPWKLLVTSLLMTEAPRMRLPQDKSSIKKIFEQFGFMSPKDLANWDFRQGEMPSFEENPLGVVRGDIEIKFPSVRLEVQNITCAACHSSPTYDRNGMPNPDSAWIGEPSTSLNFQLYVTTVFESFKLSTANSKVLFTYLKKFFPDISEVELKTYKSQVLPTIRGLIKNLNKAHLGSFVPYASGGPGHINGVAQFKIMLGVQEKFKYNAEERGFVQVPSLSDLGFRSSLTWDGLYAIRGEKRFRTIKRNEVEKEGALKFDKVLSFFPVQAMGVAFNRAHVNFAKTREVLEWISNYTPPKFPGEVDEGLAKIGRGIFHRSCSKCHGTYSEGIENVQLASYPNRHVADKVNQTDPTRWQVVASDFLAREVAKTSFTKYIDIKDRAQGYVAPKLTNIWMTAPYLHNGSIPTLWHLMHPEKRPIKFEVGGHRLDFVKMGIHGQVDDNGVYRYAPGYSPWSKPQIYDTTTKGRHNTGHTWQFNNISEFDKQALLEYLKVL